MSSSQQTSAAGTPPSSGRCDHQSTRGYAYPRQTPIPTAATSPLDRRRFIQFSAGSLALAAVGCRRRPSANRRGSTLIVAYPGSEKDLNPIDQANYRLIFLTLLAENENGELEGRLAERWEHSPDYREWTFHLRKGARWHDGVPATAHDVKFTLALLAHPDLLALGPHDIESMTVLDDSTIAVRYGSPNAQRGKTTTAIFPKHLLENLDPKNILQWNFWSHPVGNGPYRLARVLPQTMMEFAANPDYYRGKPRIERVVFKFLRDAGVAEIVSGNVDVLPSASPAHAALDAQVRAYYGFSIQPYAIFWQNAHPLFRDAGVRRALTLAINRRELARVLNLPDSLPILDGPYTVWQIRRGELPDPLPYDPAQAGRLLDSAGWRQRDAKAVRERNGQSARFTLLVRDAPGFSQIAVYVREELRQLGVGMDIQISDASVVNDKERQGKFDATLNFANWYPAFWQKWFGEKSLLGYRNPEVVSLLQRLLLATDPDEEARIRREITGIFRVDVPATFLFPSVRTVLAHRRVHGLSSPWRVDPIRYIDELWLDDRGE